MARLEEKLAALADMPPADLRRQWERAYKTPAPTLSADLLRMGLAYRLQERRIGKLPANVLRALADTPLAPSPKPGSRLVRSWNGRDVVVLATDDGFLFEDRTFASLSAIAREVTGVAWSGPRFFGLKSGG